MAFITRLTSLLVLLFLASLAGAGLLLSNELLDGSDTDLSRPVSSTTTTLKVPPSAVVGQSVTLTARVTSDYGPAPAGYVTFYRNKQNVGQATLDVDGSATLPSGGLALGAYSFTARYTSTGEEGISESTEQTITVYQAPPDLELLLSPQTLEVAYGAKSAPVTIEITSRFGLTGKVDFSCSGLPAGLACEFTPQRLALAADHSATAKFTIRNRSAEKALDRGMAGVAAVGFVVLLGIGVWSGRPKLWRSWRRFWWVTPLLLIVLTACSMERKKRDGVERETGSRTILVNATAGGSTRSTTLLLELH
ncbi:MAG: Ig-like domain repeat protein [Acidobacteria bacterium]|nr:Ig-like domain repeat protein [Acidobacteriota bacterium]